MYGLIGKMRATPGQREALLAILLEGTEAMPGCLSYVIAQDPAEADAIWITEVWTDAASHTASLSLPAVQQAIAKARPLVVMKTGTASTRAWRASAGCVSTSTQWTWNRDMRAARNSASVSRSNQNCRQGPQDREV